MSKKTTAPAPIDIDALEAAMATASAEEAKPATTKVISKQAVLKAKAEQQDRFYRMVLSRMEGKEVSLEALRKLAVAFIPSSVFPTTTWTALSDEALPDYRADVFFATGLELKALSPLATLVAKATKSARKGLFVHLVSRINGFKRMLCTADAQKKAYAKSKSKVAFKAWKESNQRQLSQHEQALEMLMKLIEG